MQLDFEGVGFKLRIPIYNRDGMDLKLRTAVIPLTDYGSVQSIKIKAMRLTDEKMVVTIAEQNDISPSVIEVGESRKTINAVFSSVEDIGDVKYELCIEVINLSTSQKISIFYVFNAGSTIATFKGVDIESNISDREDVNSKPITEETEEPEILLDVQEKEIKEADDLEQEEEVTDNTSLTKLSKGLDEEEALEKATKLLWIANKQIEEASVKLLDRDARIAILEEELKKCENVHLFQEKIEKLEAENEKLSESYSLTKKELGDCIRELGVARTQVSDLKTRLEQVKSAPSLPPVSELEKHLNDIVEYMDITAKNAGISLENIYVRTSMKEGKRHVNVYGEIRFAKGRSSLSSGCSIKASLYDASGKIEIEGSQYVSTSFKGYDTFNIGWHGGSDSSWLSETKIRIFVV